MYEDILEPIYFCVAVYFSPYARTFCFVKGFVGLGLENKKNENITKDKHRRRMFWTKLMGLRDRCSMGPLLCIGHFSHGFLQVCTPSQVWVNESQSNEVKRNGCTGSGCQSRQSRHWQHVLIMSQVNSKGKQDFALNVVSCIILILVSLIPIRISPLPTPKTNVKRLHSHS